MARQQFKKPMGYYGAATSQAEQPVQSGAVTYNPNYYNTDRGRQELQQRQSDQLQSHIRNLRDQIQRQSEVRQSGSDVFDAGEKAERTEILQSVIGSLETVQPLVESGVADSDFVSKMMGKAVGETIGLQRQSRQADREAQAVAQLAKNAGSQRQVEGALEAMRKAYPPEVLARSNAYLQLTNLEGPIQEARQESMGKYAMELGLSQDEVQWDYDNNQPMLNKQRAADRLLVQKEREIPIQQEIERRKIAAGARPTKPERWRYKSNDIGGEAAAESAYRRDLELYEREYAGYLQNVYGNDPRVMQAAEQMRPANPATKATLPAGGLMDPTPQNPDMIEKMVRAGLKPPGVYIGLDGNKYEITGE